MRRSLLRDGRGPQIFIAKVLGPGSALCDFGSPGDFHALLFSSFSLVKGVDCDTLGSDLMKTILRLHMLKAKKAEQEERNNFRNYSAVA
jgi:hypothetical protein